MIYISRIYAILISSVGARSITHGSQLPSISNREKRNARLQSEKSSYVTASSIVKDETKNNARWHKRAAVGCTCGTCELLATIDGRIIYADRLKPPYKIRIHISSFPPIVSFSPSLSGTRETISAVPVGAEPRAPRIRNSI